MNIYIVMLLVLLLGVGTAMKETRSVERAVAALRLTCPPQKGERVHAEYWYKGELYCVFSAAPVYAEKLRTRKAVKGV